MIAIKLIGNAIFLMLLMGCKQQDANLSVDPSEPATTREAIASTGGEFYLQPKELAEQMVLAKQGDNQAAIRVADHYGLGEGTPKRAYPWLVMASDRGSIKAMRTLGVYLSGDGGFDNCKKALELLERAKREGTQDELRQNGIEDTLAHLKADFNNCIKH